MFRHAAALVFLGASFLTCPGTALELSIGYPVLEQALADQLFEDQGRYYLSGDSSDGCNYAYLEAPRLSAEGGRLILKVHFSGRIGTMVFDQCVGAGDAFDVSLSGVPRVTGEVVRLAEPRFEVPNRPQYEQLVREALTGAVAGALRFDLGAEVRRLTNTAANQGYRLTVQTLTITGLSPQADSLRVVLDLRGAVSR